MRKGETMSPVSPSRIRVLGRESGEVPMVWNQFWFHVQFQPFDSHLITNLDENYFYFYVLF
jgi:hypothetical protein